jgi:hypothetical protein
LLSTVTDGGSTVAVAGRSAGSLDADPGAFSDIADPMAVTTKKAVATAVFVSLLARIMVPLELSPLSRMDQLGSRLMPKALCGADPPQKPRSGPI